MFYEEVVIQPGDTVSKLGIAYAHKVSDWEKIWTDTRNAGLVGLRKAPEKIQPGDTLCVPIPWKVISKSLTKTANGAGMIANRDGELGQRLTWVQTVYQANQPIKGTTQFCVDGCPAVGDFGDDKPFYFTSTHFTKDPNFRKKFVDYPSRPAPDAAKGTTTWRAVVSLAVATSKRVTIWNSMVWGFDMTSAKVITLVGPRAATPYEVGGHLNLLRKGVGTGPLTFGKAGWTFRRPLEEPAHERSRAVAGCWLIC